MVVMMLMICQDELLFVMEVAPWVVLVLVVLQDIIIIRNGSEENIYLLTPQLKIII